jgi:nitrate reductase NapE component
LLPNFTFQQYSTDKSAGLLRESLFNMKALAQSAINDSQIFLSIGDQIAEQIAQNQLDLDHQTFSIKTIETILIFLNPVLVVGLVVGFARIYWQFRTITAALLLIRPQGANAAIPPRKIFVPNQSHTPNPAVGQPQVPAFTLPNLKQIEFQSDATWQEISVAILALILLLLLLHYIGPMFLLCCRKLKKSVKTISPNVEFNITLSVGNTDQYVSLPVLSLPFGYEEYDFKAEKFLTGLTVEKYLRPHLKIRWPELKISHRFAPLIYQLPKSLSLTYLQAYKLRQILRQPHYALMHVRFSSKPQLFALMESDWLTQSAGTNVRQQSGRSVTLPRDNPHLYPQLEEATFV